MLLQEQTQRDQGLAQGHSPPPPPRYTKSVCFWGRAGSSAAVSALGEELLYWDTHTGFLLKALKRFCYSEKLGDQSAVSCCLL